MRIISGTARGTKLYTLDGIETRPTLDRVRESIFNILQGKIKDAVFLDLFSGSGAVGIEAASRGAEKVILCDKSKRAIEIINKNIEKTHMQDKIKVYNMNFKECLDKITDIKFNLIYLDPPYDTDYIEKSIEQILKLDILKQDATIIAETDNEKIISNLRNQNIKIIDERKYGRAKILFIKKKA